MRSTGRLLSSAHRGHGTQLTEAGQRVGTGANLHAQLFLGGLLLEDFERLAVEAHEAARGHARLEDELLGFSGQEAHHARAVLVELGGEEGDFGRGVLAPGRRRGP
jgi:predicted metal-dependent hydrolase